MQYLSCKCFIFSKYLLIDVGLMHIVNIMLLICMQYLSCKLFYSRYPVTNEISNIQCHYTCVCDNFSKDLTWSLSGDSPHSRRCCHRPSEQWFTALEKVGLLRSTQCCVCDNFNKDFQTVCWNTIAHNFFNKFTFIFYTHSYNSYKSFESKWAFIIVCLCFMHWLLNSVM